MPPKEAVIIYEKNGYDKQNIGFISESDDWYFIFTSQWANSGIIIPEVLINKKTNNLLSDYGDFNFIELNIHEVPENEYR